MDLPLIILALYFWIGFLDLFALLNAKSESTWNRKQYISIYNSALDLFQWHNHSLAVNTMLI